MRMVMETFSGELSGGERGRAAQGKRGSPRLRASKPKGGRGQHRVVSQSPAPHGKIGSAAESRAYVQRELCSYQRAVALEHEAAPPAPAKALEAKLSVVSVRASAAPVAATTSSKGGAANQPAPTSTTSACDHLAAAWGDHGGDAAAMLAAAAHAHANALMSATSIISNPSAFSGGNDDAHPAPLELPPHLAAAAATLLRAPSPLGGGLAAESSSTSTTGFSFGLPNGGNTLLSDEGGRGCVEDMGMSCMPPPVSTGATSSTYLFDLGSVIQAKLAEHARKKEEAVLREWEVVVDPLDSAVDDGEFVVL